MKRLTLLLFLFITGTLMYLSVGSKVTANLDSFIYELSFKPGARHKVVQGYGGRFSHKNKAALDFGMPEGTPIYAARGGKIYSYKEDSDEGGPLPGYNGKANYIIIKHSDGSFGCYWHLRKGGVVAKRETVRQGQVIGYSGSTGFVLRPHLHFTVKRVLSYAKDAFVRTRFRTSDGVRLLEGGELYERPLQ